MTYQRATLSNVKDIEQEIRNAEKEFAVQVKDVFLHDYDDDDINYLKKLAHKLVIVVKDGYFYAHTECMGTHTLSLIEAAEEFVKTLITTSSKPDPSSQMRSLRVFRISILK